MHIIYKYQITIVDYTIMIIYIQMAVSIGQEYFVYTLLPNYQLYSYA